MGISVNSLQKYRKQEEERLSQMSPEERDKYEQEQKERLLKCISSVSSEYQDRSAALLKSFSDAIPEMALPSSLLPSFESISKLFHGGESLDSLRPNLAYSIPVLKDHKAETLVEIANAVDNQNEVLTDQNQLLTSLIRETGVQNELLKESLAESIRNARDSQRKYTEERRNRIVATWIAIVSAAAAIASLVWR